MNKMITRLFSSGLMIILFSINVIGQDEIFKVVEEMPRFPGCEEMEDKNEKHNCAQGKMLQYIYSTLQYPSAARVNKVEGTAIIRFIVDIDGSVVDSQIMRDPGEGCGEAALAVVESFNTMENRWIPGKQRGKAVKVQYTLPVKFKLAK